MFGQHGGDILGFLILIAVFVIFLFVLKYIFVFLEMFLQKHNKTKEKIEGVYRLPNFVKVIGFFVYIVVCVFLLVYIS